MKLEIEADVRVEISPRMARIYMIVLMARIRWVFKTYSINTQRIRLRVS